MHFYFPITYTLKIIIMLKATLLGSYAEYVYMPVPAKLSKWIILEKVKKRIDKGTNV